MYYRVSENKEDEKLCKENNLISLLYMEIFWTIEISLDGMIKMKVTEE